MWLGHVNIPHSHPATITITVATLHIAVDTDSPSIALSDVIVA